MIIDTELFFIAYYFLCGHEWCVFGHGVERWSASLMGLESTWGVMSCWHKSLQTMEF